MARDSEEQMGDLLFRITMRAGIKQLWFTDQSGMDLVRRFRRHVDSLSHNAFSAASNEVNVPDRKTCSLMVFVVRRGHTVIS